jgi:Mg2+/Co2+ transporter CorB
MDVTLLLSVGAIVLLLIVGGFFSGSETALTAVSRGRMHQLEKDGSVAAAHINRLTNNRERMIGAVLLGNTFVSILASSLATWALEAHFGPRSVVIATAIMTLVILIFAEVLPKTLAITHTDRFALTVASPLLRIVAVLAPIVMAVQWLVWTMLSPFGVSHKEMETADAAHEEIRGALDLHHREGTVEREHRDMIGAILDMHNLRVVDVMIHRKNMLSVDADQSPRQILNAVMETHHTRVPLWRGNPENIIGILHTNDMAHAFIEHGGQLDGIDLAALAVKPWFVPDTMTLEEQLAAFRAKRTHFALVVDEYGALQGLVTLEDILGEIFGEIPDEHQTPERPDVRRRPDGSYLIDGQVPVRELNRELDWNLPDDEAITIAGLVIHESRTIPEPGQRFAFFGYKFEVLRRVRNQITALLVTPPPSSPPPAA